MSALSNASGLILGSLAQTRCDDVYLLRGKQLNTKAAQNGTVLQDALSDVTIVLEHQPSRALTLESGGAPENGALQGDAAEGQASSIMLCKETRKLAVQPATRSTLAKPIKCLINRVHVSG